MLNILIACDHKSSREKLSKTLAANPRFHVLAVCADTHAAIAITGNEQPDIVFIDGSSDPLAAIEATKKIVSISTAGVIGLSCQADSSFAKHMLAAGALGYLGGEVSAAVIIAAVNEVAKDNLYSNLNTIQLPVPTPLPVSAFRKKLLAIRANTQQQINEVTVSHWYAILSFTN